MPVHDMVSDPVELICASEEKFPIVERQVSGPSVFVMPLVQGANNQTARLKKFAMVLERRRCVCADSIR